MSALARKAWPASDCQHQARARSLLGSVFKWSDWQLAFLRSMVKRTFEPSAKQAWILEDLEVFRARVTSARDFGDVSTIIRRHTDLRSCGSGGELVGLCPFHTERTPSFRVNDAKGRYYCQGCGEGGDAIRFLMIRERLSFRQAIEAISDNKQPVVTDEERAKRQSAHAQEIAKRVAVARSIVARMVSPAGTPAEVYARSRGIMVPLPQTVGFVMTPRWQNAETGECGRDHPAIAFSAQDVRGAVVGVQCVFLADGGRRKYEPMRRDGSIAKSKLSFGLIAGAAIRLGAVRETITVAEGPEDGLTLMQECGGSVWVAAGTSMMPKMQFPAMVRDVIIAADGDDPGRQAADKAGHAFASLGLTVRTMFPASGIKDFNEELMMRSPRR